MEPKGNKNGKIPAASENPFRVPDGYFGEMQSQVMDRIRPEQAEPQPGRGRKISMRPYIALAASISGIALVVYILLQTVTGRLNEQAFYDLELLEKSGITQDEWMLEETYDEANSEGYSVWEEDAMQYLSSNEVDLIYLIDSNENQNQ